MRSLDELGFVVGAVPASVAITLDGTEVSLPQDYLMFLGCEPPEGIEFGFKFLREDSSEVWEGQVTEFIKHERGTVNSAIVSPPWDRTRKLLPIAADAGGNYLYLDLTQDPMRVVDVSYQSGAISPVAGSFGEFIDILYPIDA